jgi:ABC-type uncharacterized transport system substrate-binding protein
MEDNNNKKKDVLPVIFLAVLVILTIGIVYNYISVKSLPLVDLSINESQNDTIEVLEVNLNTTKNTTQIIEELFTKNDTCEGNETPVFN